MVNDDNNGSVGLDEDGERVVRGGLHRRRSATRMDGAFDVHARRADARREPRASAGPGSSRPTCRARAAWAATRSGRSSTRDAQSWDVKRLYVGDGSLVPRTLSVNPSLTIMALADRLAAHLHADPHGYLS